MDNMTQLLLPPVFKFALREDLKEDKQFLPTRAEPKATGWDVRAAFEDRKELFVKPFQHIKIPLGFRTFCPNGWWYDLKPRSSTFAKKNLHSLYGTIDETYEGQLVFACQYIPEFELYGYNDDNPYDYDSHQVEITIDAKELVIDFGEAIGQLIPRRRDEMIVEEATNEEYDYLCKVRSSVRGDGGFGSTDRK